MGKIVTVADKLVKVNECVNVHFYDNAFMVEATGRNHNDDWASVRLMCSDLDAVHALLTEIESLPRDT